MNTAAPALNRTTRLASMAMAFVLTVVTLAGVNGLAQGSGDVEGAAQLAGPATTASAAARG